MTRVSTRCVWRVVWLMQVVDGSCPGPNGDSFCKIVATPSSYCVPGVWKCLGSTRNCGCDFSATTSAPSTPFTSLTSVQPPSTRFPFTIRPFPVTSSPVSSTLQTTTLIPTTSTTRQPTPVYDGAPLFVWAEWPEISGEAAYRAYYSKMISVLNSGPTKFNRLILRITNPTLGSLSNLWTVSTNSILYQSLISKLPPSVTELMIYPYLLVAPDQRAWVQSMETTTPLEGVFKYAAKWNSLLSTSGSPIRFSGVVVDGEEKVGFASEIPSVPLYKQAYNIGVFGYATGYDTTGDWNRYGPYVDQFYLEMYDFYVYNAPTLELVQNTDVTSSSAFVSELTSNVLPANLLKNYNNPKFQFMWSIQNSASSNCLYPLNGSCGSKEDFGTQSLEYFLNFLAELKALYPSTFGSRPNGIFQFSFIPNSWFS
jgi:hypothetical protein